MPFTPPPISVPNIPLNVAKNLRYTDSNGTLVTRQYPNDYIENIGGNLSTQIDNYNQVLTVLNTYNTDITNLQTSVNNILTSGATAIPQVNGYCLNGNTSQPINVITALLVSNTCSYNTILGTPTSLAQAILAENASVLNTLPAFSQSSAMAGLTGWINTPTTVADAVNNQWISYLDARAGVTTAIGAVTPSCSTVIVDAQVTLPAFGTGFNIYFDGYTFVPTGFTDNGSTIRITDSAGNTAINGINIITQSNTNIPYNFATSGTSLLSGSTYTVYINSNVTNSTLGVTCNKTIIKFPVTANNDLAHLGYDIGSFNVNTSGSTATTFVLTSSLPYTPRFATINSLDISSSAALINNKYWLTYSPGTITLNLGGSTYGSALNYQWISFK